MMLCLPFLRLGSCVHEALRPIILHCSVMNIPYNEEQIVDQVLPIRDRSNASPSVVLFFEKTRLQA